MFQKFLFGLAWFLAIQLVSVTTAWAGSKSVKIAEQTDFYIIGGRTAPDFAASMSKKGPYSRQHRRRAWATASKDMSYQLVRRKTSKGCRIIGVKVKLNIIYKLPKLRSLKGVSRKNRRKWKKMYALLSRHERVHGRYYRQFAHRIEKSLLKLPRQSSCRVLDKKAERLVERLNKADRKLNRKFDDNDHKNYRRMKRLYKG